MSGSASIGGLASGLDTAGIISQLMQLEAVPQTQLQSRVTTEQRQVTSLTTLNSKLASLTSTAKNLATATTWDTAIGTSSNAAVTVSVAKSASPTSFSVTVDQTALSHQLGFTGQAKLTDVVTTGSTQVRIDHLDGTTANLETGDGTLQGLIDAINNPTNATGLRATAVRVGTDSYQLLVESIATGKAQDFDLTNTDGTALLGGHNVRAARDAQVTLGAGITATSTTNTFTDLVRGVNLTVAAGTPSNTTAAVTVSRDTAGISATVKSFVDTVNGVLDEADSLTAVKSGSTTPGILAGDTTVRAVRDQLLNTVYPADGTSLSVVGIQVDRTGRLTFDEAAFKAAYDKDPSGVAARFTTGATDGFGERVRKVADAASNSSTGSLTVAITGRNNGIKTLQDSIAQWDIRLQLRRDSLTRQFTALETAMSQMTSQSSWLAGQIANLPSGPKS